ncbi:bifunctional diaminohydroxyphosphoribosylaminopyrimidine deaminase/5-amino-6-(5-phosphoribosylamino)uracil reductase RibD [Roseibacillus persicicus]|uniref:bifunctional diaminohydroxyphosphoribosylaminopyrimidine deaminase/5-amino-6-(5-phosphoribosylamino)uracil reductase RibD n=1 Tax=Roseibacillus persicicus TaxID=454148 RepID=UPI00398BA40F
MMSSTDEHFMALALREGEKGQGQTAPNPSVGAVVVREGEILGKGYHPGAGLPHAEVHAIADARSQGHDLAGSEIFVTLEPCSTTGRTPPCTSAILQAGIKRVVWAADDPNPAHCGAARQILEAAGIEVATSVLVDEAEYLHRGFFKVQRTGLPWVIVKTAMSLDGRITRPSGEGQWLTGSEARADVQILRGEVDAILTSGETARRDNPRLDYRGERPGNKQPVRVVATEYPLAGLPAEAHLLQPNESGATRFVSGDLREIMASLAADGLQTVLVEAGGKLVGQLLDAGLVDEWVTYLAPLVAGGDVVAVGGEGCSVLDERPRLKNVSYQQFGADIRVRGLLRRD